MNKVSSRTTLSRTHFWSHILFSMIALFALPNVQGVETSDSLRLEYQNSSIQPQVTRSTFVQQAQLQQIQIPRLTFQSEKIHVFLPHFVGNIFTQHAPIRGSPFFFMIGKLIS